jgi:hypothetical protein
MKTLTGRQYSFKPQTQIKLQNKFLDPLASKINGSLTRPTALLSFTCVLIHGNNESQAQLFSKASSIHSANHAARPSSS